MWRPDLTKYKATVTTFFQGKRRRVIALAAVPVVVGSAVAIGCFAANSGAGEGAAQASTGTGAAATMGSAPPPAAPGTFAPPSAKWPELPLKTDGPRLYSKTRYLYIYPEPNIRVKWIGYLWVGGSVKLKSATPVKAKKGSGCVGTWYEVEPKGVVCVENDRATLDGNDAIYTELRKHGADYTSPWPYYYGESKGESRLKELEGITSPKWPLGLQDVKQVLLPPRSTVAWTEEINAKNGLPYLYTSDLSFLHKDSVKPYPRSEFKGVHLGGEVQLPLAFFRRIPRPKLKKDGENFTPNGESWARLSWVKLTGKSEKSGKSTYWETAENGLWLEEHDTGIVKSKYDSTPWKSPVKQVSSGQMKTGPDRRTWIEVAALHGWMIAYEDDEPIFATMISGGKLGAAAPRASEPHQSPATTPMGHFQIDGKFVTTTLKAELNDGTAFVHSEVPWSQHFYSKYLLHTAYWHDAWGEGKSGGCVNMAPTDAKWLFDWTQPSVPEGWHGYKTKTANSGGKKKIVDEETATIVVVHM